MLGKSVRKECQNLKRYELTMALIIYLPVLLVLSHHLSLTDNKLIFAGKSVLSMADVPDFILTHELFIIFSQSAKQRRRRRERVTSWMSGIQPVSSQKSRQSS